MNELARNHYKSYHNYILEFLNGNSSSFNRYKSDKRLTQTEKRLLTARVSIRQREWNQALDLLNDLTCSSDFLKAEKLFISGTIHEYMGEFQKSAYSNLEASELYNKIEDQFGLFNSLYNTSVAYHRLGLYELSSFYLEKCKVNSSSQEDDSFIYRALAYNELNLGNQDKAKINLIKLEELMPFQTETDRNISLTILGDLHFRVGDWEKSKSYFSKLKSIYSNREKPRVYFELNLLESLINKESLGERPGSLSESTEFSLKWDILKALESGERDSAEKNWDTLAEKFPQRYYRDFKCKNLSDENSIFMTFVKEKCNIKFTPEIDLSTVKGKKGKVLLEKLKRSDFPVRKEILIEDIWGVAYDPCFDQRFYKLVERLRKSLPFKIVNKNNAYYIAS